MPVKILVSTLSCLFQLEPLTEAVCQVDREHFVLVLAHHRAAGFALVLRISQHIHQHASPGRTCGAIESGVDRAKPSES